jgi:membrane-bound metal-dependent hydrolase YbcI (DUF457 family)
MATPIAHTLAGYLVFSASAPPVPQQRQLLLWCCLVMALAPDLDFLPGLLVGQPARYHQGISHSLGLAVLTSLALAGVYSLRQRPMAAAWWRFCLAYVSHLALDLVTADTRPPAGIPVLWPLSSRVHHAPWQIFAGVQHATTTGTATGEWLRHLLQSANLQAVGMEVLVLLPVVLLVHVLSRSGVLTR